MEFHRCYGCMEETVHYPCPHCGYVPEGKAVDYALRPGSILNGKYLVGRVLGQGGFGITYIGWDLALERKVAIKEYFPSGQVVRQNGASSLLWYSTEQAESARESGMEMFLKEARKMNKVRKIPQVVQVLDLFQDNETAYIAMDFVEGENLKQYLKRTGPLSWEQMQDIFLPVIQAMEQVHRAGLIHRDLSPDNLMLLPDGGVQILDLGAAKDLSINSGASSMQVAKGGFSPLEQYHQRGGSGSWTDVYALAATIYYTLTGVVPPAAVERVDEDTLRWDLPPLQKLPQERVEALKKAMALRTKERTQTMEELYRGIAVSSRKNNVREKVIPVPAEAKPAKSEKKEKKWGKLLLLMGAALICIAIAAAVLPGKPTAKPEEPPVAAAQETTAPLSPEEAAYAEAEDLLAGGDRYDAAVAFYALGDYRDARERSFVIWEEIAHRETISAGKWHTAGLKADGTVVAVGNNGNGQCDVTDWQDIVAVSAGGNHTIGLKADGTVVAVGYNKYGQCNVTDWQDIVSVSAGSEYTVGLKADDTVVAVGRNEPGRCDVSDWQDIVAVSAGGSHTIGLKADGTVVAVGGNDHGRYDVSDWQDIVAVSAGDSHAIGLKADGTVVAVGSNGRGQCDVTDWQDIVAVSAGASHTIGLKADGTVVTVGRNEFGQRSVWRFTDIKIPKMPVATDPEPKG